MILRSRSFVVSGALAVCFVAIGLGSACSGSASLVDAGGSCELASDCVEGLVCIPDPASVTGRSCSSDLTSIQMTEFPDGGQDAPSFTPPDSDATSLYPDATTSTPDATTTPPADSGGTTPPKDSGGTPPQDSAPPPDTGSPVDAATGG